MGTLQIYALLGASFHALMFTRASNLEAFADGLNRSVQGPLKREHRTIVAALSAAALIVSWPWFAWQFAKGFVRGTRL